MENANDKMIKDLTAKISEMKAKAEQKTKAELKAKSELQEKENLKAKVEELKAKIALLKSTVKELKETVALLKSEAKVQKVIIQNESPSKVNQVEEPFESGVVQIRKLVSKRYKLEGQQSKSIELTIVVRGTKTYRKRKVIISKINDVSNLILSAMEFECDTLHDLHLIENYLNELNVGKQSIRINTWLINKLEDKKIHFQHP